MKTPGTRHKKRVSREPAAEGSAAPSGLGYGDAATRGCASLAPVCDLTAPSGLAAVYSGPWVADAKVYFSKKGCVAQKIGERYVNGSADRQEILETAITWKIDSKKEKDIEQYMALMQGEDDALELWLYFQKVINWIDGVFPHYRKEMKGLEWGRFFKEYDAKKFNPAAMERDVAALMQDREVQSKKGIYEFLLSGRTRAEKLNLRAFDDAEKREAFERQGGICPVCNGKFAFEEMEGDHIVAWSKGGKTVPENLQMLCARCNALKSDKF